MLKPMDIHNKEFKKAMRGYDAEEVDEFLDEIIVDFEKMQRELDLLRNQLKSYSDNMSSYKDRENALNNALVSAQQFGDHIKKEAEASASIMLQEAEEKAKTIINTSEQRLSAVEKDYKFLTDQYSALKENMRTYLQQQLEMLDHKDADFATPDVVADKVVQVKKLVEAEAESEETKLNVKLKELMDAKIYNEKSSTGSDYRY